MDGSRPGPVKPGASCGEKPQRTAKNKHLTVSSTARPDLTPFSRLAKFKAIRDRNLAKESSSSRTSLISRASMIGMEQKEGPSNSTVAQTNGKQVKAGPVKQKNQKNPREPKGVESPQNGAEPSAEQPQNGHSAATNGVDSSPQNGVESPAQAPQPEDIKNEIVEIQVEDVSGSEGEPENGLESEGSSLDVVIDESSSGESLDLNVTAASSQEDFQIPVAEVPPPVEAASNVDEPFIPDVIKRLGSGGRVSSRPTLRGKRSADDIYSESGAKRARTDDSGSGALSTSWQFFSPRSVLKKVWTRQGPANPKPEDDSMIVNVSTAEEPKTGKWCRIM